MTSVTQQSYDNDNGDLDKSLSPSSVSSKIKNPNGQKNLPIKETSPPQLKSPYTGGITSSRSGLASFEHLGNPLSSEDYANLSCYGIKLMLNNDFAGAEKLFFEHKDNSAHMAVGYCYLTFLNAVMSFEDDQIKRCRDCLKETERKYSHLSSNPTTPSTPMPSDNSWYNSVKNMFTGGTDKQSVDPVWQLERLVVMADCQVLLALLNFLQQELGSMMRGGWVLRRAWKLYDNTHARLTTMCTDAHANKHTTSNKAPDTASPATHCKNVGATDALAMAELGSEWGCCSEYSVLSVSAMEAFSCSALCYLRLCSN
uniref:Tetratricopeptide repeat protein 39C-like n=1 Tax=Hirondellea gigas TaxID=1518452 RepID=A0A6A7GBJ8_9CRUS